ncbi:MAG: Spy/CpxP family protein refolding chaperone [Candidatus Aminicenantes bacterium]|nr:MAG: Spy/CpxP family protein refolding chaperone [Candidatus Aminicenantes bacterium]
MKKYVRLTVLVLFLSLVLYPSMGRSQESNIPEDDAALESPQASRDFLGLTPEQKAKLEEFRKSGREKRRAYFDEMRKVRLEMREMIKDAEANEKEILKLYDQMARLLAEQFRNSLQRSKEFKKILTPEQLEKLKSAKKRMSRRGHRQRSRFRGERGFARRGDFSRRGRMDLSWRRGARLRGRPFMFRRWWR